MNMFQILLQFLPRDARSAKRGIAVVPTVRLSLGLSVTLTYRGLVKLIT